MCGSLALHYNSDHGFGVLQELLRAKAYSPRTIRSVFLDDGMATMPAHPTRIRESDSQPPIQHALRDVGLCWFTPLAWRCGGGIPPLQGPFGDPSPIRYNTQLPPAPCRSLTTMDSRPTMKVRILATADIHIGRRPSRLASAETAARYSCAQMWLSIVEQAIELDVDLVVLAGDVVDHENRFFEATGPLEDGLIQLAEVGIPTYAVGGNHDFDVLPKIVDAVGSEWLHLVGRNGRWEETIVERGGEPILRIHGWSFPTATVASSPIDDYRLRTDDSLPTLGLLHADLDARHSDYAPVLREELLECRVSAWILGHVHRPRWEPPRTGPGLLYTGSPQAMDPGETGPHGPWLVELHGPRRIGARQLAMSQVRYEGVDIDLTGVNDRDELESQLTASVGQYVTELAEETDESIEQLSLRLILCGRTPFSSQLEGLTRPMVEQFERRYRGMTVRVDKISNETLPVIDLDELAEKHDPTGVLARALISLQSGESSRETAELIRKAQTQMLEVHAAPAYSALRTDSPPGAEEVRRTLIRQGRLLLDTLLAQRGAIGELDELDYE